MATKKSTPRKPLNINSLCDLLVQRIDFEEMNRASKIRLFLATTNVRSRNVKVFGIDEAISAEDILDRVNEITFNSSLIKDAHIATLRYILMHSLRSDDVLADLPVNSKMRSDWEFLTLLRDRGRSSAGAWLEQNYSKVGVASSRVPGLRCAVLTNVNTICHTAGQTLRDDQIVTFA
jgi:hypothetical protein